MQKKSDDIKKPTFTLTRGVWGSSPPSLPFGAQSTVALLAILLSPIRDSRLF